MQIGLKKSCFLCDFFRHTSSCVLATPAWYFPRVQEVWILYIKPAVSHFAAYQHMLRIQSTPIYSSANTVLLSLLYTVAGAWERAVVGWLFRFKC